MFKIIIVDDEELDREGYLRQLDWEALGFTGIFSAENGYDAMEILTKEECQLLLTDVIMPGMSGIQLAEKAKSLYPEIKVIFISGHDDFEFVKNAVSLSACEYILKPVDTEELEKSVLKALNEIKASRDIKLEKLQLLEKANESKQVRKQILLRDLLYGTISIDDLWREFTEYEIEIVKGHYICMVAELDDFRDLMEQYTVEELESRVRAVVKGLEAFRLKDYSVEIIQLEQSKFVLLASSGRAIDRDNLQKSLDSALNNLIDHVLEVSGIGLTIGISNPATELAGIKDSYTQACEALQQKMFSGKGLVLFYDASGQENMEPGLLEGIFNELCKCVVTRDLNKAHYITDHLFDRFESLKIKDSAYVQGCIIQILGKLQLTFLQMNRSFENVFGDYRSIWDKLLRFETILDVRQWLKNIFTALIEHLKENTTTGSEKIAAEVANYIEKNYHEEITLKKIADELHYSANHVGLVF